MSLLVPFALSLLLPTARPCCTRLKRFALCTLPCDATMVVRTSPSTRGGWSITIPTLWPCSVASGATIPARQYCAARLRMPRM